MRTDRIVLNVILYGLAVGVFSAYLGLVGLMLVAFALGFFTAFSDNKYRRIIAFGTGMTISSVCPPDVLTLLCGAQWGGVLALFTFIVFAAIGWLLVQISTV